MSHEKILRMVAVAELMVQRNPPRYLNATRVLADLLEEIGPRGTPASWGDVTYKPVHDESGAYHSAWAPLADGQRGQHVDSTTLAMHVVARCIVASQTPAAVEGAVMAEIGRTREADRLALRKEAVSFFAVVRSEWRRDNGPF